MLCHVEVTLGPEFLIQVFTADNFFTHIFKFLFFLGVFFCLFEDSKFEYARCFSTSIIFLFFSSNLFLAYFVSSSEVCVHLTMVFTVI